MPSLLIDKAVEWHTRKGLREDCSCEYCVRKRIGTHQISTEARWQFPVTKYSYWYNEGVLSYMKEGYRERQREELRIKLADLKQVVL